MKNLSRILIRRILVGQVEKKINKIEKTVDGMKGMLYYIQRTLHRVDCVRSGNRKLLRKNDLTMNDGYHIITK